MGQVEKPVPKNIVIRCDYRLSNLSRYVQSKLGYEYPIHGWMPWIRYAHLGVNL